MPRGAAALPFTALSLEDFRTESPDDDPALSPIDAFPPRLSLSPIGDESVRGHFEDDDRHPEINDFEAVLQHVAVPDAMLCDVHELLVAQGTPQPPALPSFRGQASECAENFGLTTDEVMQGVEELADLYVFRQFPRFPPCLPTLPTSQLAALPLPTASTLDDILTPSVRIQVKPEPEYPNEASRPLPGAPQSESSSQPPRRFSTARTPSTQTRSRGAAGKASTRSTGGQVRSRRTRVGRVSSATAAAERESITPPETDWDRIEGPVAEPWHEVHGGDRTFLCDLVEETFPYAALALCQKDFDQYDAKFGIRKGLLKNDHERAALTVVRRKITGRERSRLNRAKAKRVKILNKERWRKARMTLCLLAALRIMKKGGKV